MTTAAGAALQIVQGAELVQAFGPLPDATGATINLTGQQVTLAVTNKPGDPNPPSITKDSFNFGGITVTNAVGGLISVTFVPADTSTLAVGVYYYDIWVDDTLGNQRPAVQVAVFQVLPRATKLKGAAPTVIDTGTLTLAPLASAVIGPYTLDPAMVSWLGAVGTDGIAGVQMVVDGASLPASNTLGGIVFVLEETNNQNELRWRASNRSTTLTLSCRWKIFAE